MEKEITDWQESYNAQFRKSPYEFDWDAFNQQGRELAGHIQFYAPEDVEIHYVESDDRDFFNPEDCETFSTRPARKD
ncbi:hypothetical protein [Pontiella sulfatireligans]|uniref:hypothetical protein n=1 Tax=Pontiella sulfatireligans TaxID=2750658 RepID=UPI00109C690A|nr:hypothetical protein [Pontiella sulfatireligans]